MTSQMWQEIQDQYDVMQRVEGQVQHLERLSRQLGHVKRLILSGTGASLYACRAAAYAFMKHARLLPHVLPAAELGYVHPEPGTLVILVSQSGQSLETQQAVQMLKERQIPFWGVTNNRDSHLGKGADELLFMDAGSEVSSATKTYTATLGLLCLLAKGAQTGPLAPGIQATLGAAAPVADLWATELLEQDVIYLLGMGPLGVTAEAGGLLLKEKTFIHASGMSVSEFRHGNIEVVRPGLPIVLLASTADACAEAVKHGEYFASLGAEVYLVADAPVVSDRIPPQRILQVHGFGDEVLGQLTAVIPLQMLAERIADRKGYDVDGFRYIAKVVDTYKL